MSRRRRIAVVYGSTAGVGGLGLQAGNAISGLALTGDEIHAFGPGFRKVWPLDPMPQNVTWHIAPSGVSPWRSRFTPLRWNAGAVQWQNDRMLGRWAAREIARLEPDLCYTFTQVGRETLQWCEAAGVPSILENPNGHIRNFRRVYATEAAKWSCGSYRGHPAISMIERVEQEYGLAGRIRLSSEWSRSSMLEYGVSGANLTVLDQPMDLVRFVAPEAGRPSAGAMRVCFVGSLDLRKGFVYLLQAIRLIGARHIALDIVGATGDRCSKALLDRESRELEMNCAPGDPAAVYQRAELAVIPSLEDGLPFVAGEAMASGLPIIISSSCGSADWVETESTGWVVPSASAESLASALDIALGKRAKLAAMGRAARQAIERRGGPQRAETFASWVCGS